MNEGENLSIPHNPSFSSPNITSSEEPTQSTPIEPADPTITSEELVSIAGTDAGAVAAAAATMTEDDERVGAIVSSGAINRQAFTGRHYSSMRDGTKTNRAFEKNSQQNDPILINNYDEKPRSRKKGFIICAVIVLIVLVATGVIFASGILNRADNDAASEELKAWRRVGNYMIFGEDKEDEIAMEPKVAAGKAYNNGVLAKGEESKERLAKITELYNQAKEKTKPEHAAITDDAYAIMRLLEIGAPLDTSSITTLLLNGETTDGLSLTFSEAYNSLHRDGDSEVITGIINKLQMLSVDRVAVADAYIKNGCIDFNVLGNINQECRARVDNNHDPDKSISGGMKVIEDTIMEIYVDFYQAIKEMK